MASFSVAAAPAARAKEIPYASVITAILPGVQLGEGVFGPVYAAAGRTAAAGTVAVKVLSFGFSFVRDPNRP